MLPDLKVEIPELAPPQVLLEQLAHLSLASTPSASSDGPRTVKAFLAAVSVSVLATVAWLTGTLPGVASPFTREPTTPRPAPQHAPVEPGPQTVSGGEATDPVVPPKVKQHHGQGPHQGQHKPQHDNNGLHLGQTKPHQDNGHHTGQTKPHQNNGHHNGQTKPHQDNGHHNGQTKPHQNNGQTKPHHASGQPQTGVDEPADPATAESPGQSGQGHGQSGQDHGGGQGNGHRT